MKLLLLSLFYGTFLAVKALPSGPSAGCDDIEWRKFNGKCYRIVGTVGTFGDADTYCNMLRSRTLTIKSDKEQQFLEEYLFNSVSENIWLGGTRSNNKFQWRNDGIMIENNIYSNWADGKFSGNKAMACLMMLSKSSAESGKWSDDYCQSHSMIVCERTDNNATPAPEGEPNPEPETPEKPTTPDEEENDSSLKEELEKLKSNFDKRITALESIIGNQQILIDQLNENVKELSSDKPSQTQISHNTKAINNINERVNNIVYVHLAQVSGNFSGIANVLSYFGGEINNLQSKVGDIIESGSGSTDANGLKVELKTYINSQISDIDLINNVKLEYVNYRRALMVQKKNRWTTLGYV